MDIIDILLSFALAAVLLAGIMTISFILWELDDD